MSGTVLPPFTSATARPTSQHSSQPASRTGYHQDLVAPPVLQTTDGSVDVIMTETHFEESVVLEPTQANHRNGSVKPGVSSRASSRAPSVARSRASSRAPSLAPFLKSVDRGNRLEPSARPGSRGGALNLMPSLIESPVDA